MIYSMTGFGKSTALVDNKKLSVEVKSLNSKQLDLSVRQPQNYRELELDLRKLVAQSLLRGKVEVFIYCEADGSQVAPILNVPLIQQYVQQISNASAEIGIPVPNDWYPTLLRLPEVLLANGSGDTVSETEKTAYFNLVDEALTRLNDFRKQEGERLEKFFEEKIDAIQHLLDEVPQYEQSRVEKIKSRIIDSLAKLDGVQCDNNRLEQELIFYIEKLDITEEKIRLQNHLTYFLDTLHNESGQGKKLGFIAQEMGREINTLGSKANQAELQNLVVRMKDQLEQIKEQVLNVL